MLPLLKCCFDSLDTALCILIALAWLQTHCRGWDGSHESPGLDGLSTLILPIPVVPPLMLQYSPAVCLGGIEGCREATGNITASPADDARCHSAWDGANWPAQLHVGS